MREPTAGQPDGRFKERTTPEMTQADPGAVEVEPMLAELNWATLGLGRPPRSQLGRPHELTPGGHLD